MLTINISSSYKISSITVNTSQNPSVLSINGATSVSGSPSVSFEVGVSSVTILNTSSATSGTENQLRITSIVITYVPN